MCDGYTAVSAADGRTAWEILNDQPSGIDLILLDRRMPEIDGMQLLARIKDHPVFKDIPVILQTAADSKQDIADGIRAGAYYYLTKPIERNLLLSITAAAVDDVSRYNRLRKDIRDHAEALSLMTSGVFSFKTLDEADYLAAALAGICPNPRSAVVGLSELLINAIEHGNLGITIAEKARLIAEKRWTAEIESRLALSENRSKFATVDFQCADGRINFTIRDEGKGFDWRRYMDFNTSRIFDSHGRGIALARKISFDRLEYLGSGSEVVASVDIPFDAEHPQPAAITPPGPYGSGYERFHVRMEEELRVARTMQEKLLPSPQRASGLGDKYGLALSAHSETSFELGGDMWGAIPLDDNRLAIYVVDFSGHGVAAALNTFRLDSLIREMKGGGENPAEYLRTLNGPLTEMLPIEQFATMLYGVIDVAADNFTYATAGSPRPVLAEIGSGEVVIGEGGGLPLGIGDDISYENQCLPFPPGSLLLLYSDALIESRREEGGRVGKNGLTEMVRDTVRQLGDDTDAEAVLEPFFARIKRPLADDLTVICCVRSGKKVT